MQIQNISIRNYLVVWGLFLVGLFSVLNPAATNTLGVIEATLTWTFNICVPLFMLATLQIHFQKITLFNRANPWIKIFWVSLATTFLFTPLAIGFDALFGLDAAALNTPYDFWITYLKEFKAIFLPLTLCWFIINAPFLLNLNFNSLSENTLNAAPLSNLKDHAEFQKSIFAKIPQSIGNDVVYMTSELHYTKIITAHGKVLVLYNFSDAISDVERSIEGIQIHRCYWVAKKHILKVKQQELVLLNGEKLPISRRKISKLKKILTIR